MSKTNNKIFEIFLQGIGLYFTNIDRFVWYMFMPVFLQLIGFLFTIYIIYVYNNFSSYILASIPILKTPLYMNIFISSLILLGIVVWLKGLWDYFVAYGAINSMTENMLKSERVYDFPAHVSMVTRRRLSYLSLIILYLLIILMTSIPIFLVFGIVLLIYFAFIFQIFIFEPELSPIDCFKKSVTYVIGNFVQTLIMISMVGILTYIIIPQILFSFFKLIKVTTFLNELFAKFITVPMLDPLNMVLSAMGISQITPIQISTFFVSAMLIIIIIQFLLPLRVICLCLWYKNFYNNAGSMKKIDDKILKRATSDKKSRKK